jgi:isoaspartyl peptidase/L-asparaginase-like protein (Ntn-hydrolase superfamily)
MAASPLIISTWSFGQRGNRAAWPLLEPGGSALDAVERAASAVEADPEVDSVGLGGLPDANGEVSLDASIMLSPSKSGSVCYVRKYLEVASLARRVMKKTPHVMLAGDGAERFAAEQGFTPRNLLTDDARAKWMRWKDDPARRAPEQGRDTGLSAPLPSPLGRGAGGEGGLNQKLRPIDTGSPALFEESRWRNLHDTIGVLALDSGGTLAGACSTSGMPYKLPGRVGDSPIIGHGLYVDPEAGAAVATGTGELIMGICGSFLIVELMRQGAPPVDAIQEALARVEKNYTLRPEHQAAFLALRPDGDWSSGALRPGFKVSVLTPAADSIVDAAITLRRD